MENEPLLQFFAYSHLPEHLQEHSKPFGDLAQQLRRPVELFALTRHDPGMQQEGRYTGAQPQCAGDDVGCKAGAAVGHWRGNFELGLH